MGADVIKVSWDAKALNGGDVKTILLMAQPKNDSLPVAATKVNASEGMANITTNLAPSSTYEICVRDTHGRGFEYILGEFTTLPLGESLFGNVTLQHACIHSRYLYSFIIHFATPVPGN